MHLGVVHDPGFSPGLIFLFPHGNMNGAFVRFKNLPTTNPGHLKRLDFVAVQPANTEIQYSEITQLFPLTKFRKLGNLSVLTPGVDSELDTGIGSYRTALTQDEINTLPADWQ